MGKLIPIVVNSENEGGRNIKNYSRPVVRYVNDEGIRTNKAGLFTLISEFLRGWPAERNYISPIKLSEVEILRNPTTSDYHQLSKKTLAITAAGTTQGAATQLTTFYNEVTTIGAAATEAVKLPAAPVLNDVILVINNDASGDACKVFPGSGMAIDALGANNVFNLPAKSLAFFVYTATNVWQSALDLGR